MMYTGDFETTTDPEDCRVWAVGICEIGKPENFIYYNNMDSFIDFCRKSDNSTIYFHNAKFDGTFIMVWLFEHGFTHVTNKAELADNTFMTLISDAGQFYSMKIYFKKKGKHSQYVTIIDSLKILPFKVEEIAKGFDLPISKLKIDYEEYRPVGHALTNEEIDYLRNDVDIMGRSLKILFDQELTAMTQGSNALTNYKSIITEKKFEKWFPEPSYHDDIKGAYKGGFTYLNPKYKSVDIGKGIVFDVNSLYPSVMYYQPLPYGEPVYFNGQYEKDEIYNLYVQCITCQFELKPEHIPTIQIKGTPRFIPTEYLTSSNDEEVVLYLTNIDLELFFEHYDVYNIEYNGGYKFKSTIGLFKDYIDKWMKVKIESTLNGNKAMRTLAKLMLNALYGKFGTSPHVCSKIPFYDNGVIKYRLGEEDTKHAIYIPMAIFITSWARYKTITSAQKVYGRFIYADTDSLHLLGTEIPDCLDVDDVELGKWKHESTFQRARFIVQKRYMETEIISDKAFSKMEPEEQEGCYFLDGIRVKDKFTCSGLPSNCHKQANWENFKLGTIYVDKLTTKNVKGGVVLVKSEFKMRNDIFLRF